jgi:hypothetical protein
MSDSPDKLVNLGMVMRGVEDLQKCIGKPVNGDKPIYEQLRNLRKGQKLVMDASNRAFQQADYVNKRLQKLTCIEAESTPTGRDAKEIEPEYHENLISVSDDEPDSVLTRPVSVHAGKLSFRGPGIMVAVIAVIMAFGGLIALALVHKFPGLFR